MPHQEVMPFNSDPIGLDKFFLKLKERFEALQFDINDGGILTPVNLFDTNTIFLAVKDFNEKRDFGSSNKPIAKGIKLDLRDLRPNADWKSTAFLYEHSPRKIKKVEGKMELDLSFVVSYQQKLLAPDLEYQINEGLYNIVEQTIANLKLNDTDLDTYTNRETVFQDFDVDYFVSMFTNEFNHFRVRFKVDVDIYCVGYGNKITFVK